MKQTTIVFWVMGIFIVVLLAVGLGSAPSLAPDGVIRVRPIPASLLTDSMKRRLLDSFFQWRRSVRDSSKK